MKVMKIIMVLGLMFCITASDAVGVAGKVTRTLLADDGRFGACMILLNVSLASQGLDCPGGWVTFSCSGEFQAKDVAWRMFDSGQMALALGNTVWVYVDDTRKHNGYCFGEGINVLP